MLWPEDHMRRAAIISILSYEWLAQHCPWFDPRDASITP